MKPIWSLLVLVALTIAGFLSACITPQYKLFPLIKIGQEKDEVIEAAGTPFRVWRFHGQDRWYYRMTNEAGVLVDREVDFEFGKVVYTGEVRHSDSVPEDPMDNFPPDLMSKMRPTAPIPTPGPTPVPAPTSASPEKKNAPEESDTSWIKK